MASNDFRNKLMSLQGNLLNYAFMLTSNRDMAQRLLEHTTEVALERWADASDDVHLKGWAFSIMRGVFASEFALHVRPRRVVAEDVYSISLTSGEECFCVRPEGSHRSADVTRVLGELTDGYRRPMELFLAGYSVTEIASELNLTVGVVRSRVAYCRNRLRVALSA